MKVIDRDASESGLQRRMVGGRRLHCCCVCDRLDVWSDTWSHYSSAKDEDEGIDIPKFCCEECRSKAGERAKKITKKVKLLASEKEWREPVIAYREATEREKYNHAVQTQRNRKQSNDQ